VRQLTRRCLLHEPLDECSAKTFGPDEHHDRLDNLTMYSHMVADFFWPELEHPMGPLSAEALVNESIEINGSFTFQGEPNGWAAVAFPDKWVGWARLRQHIPNHGW
jgi:hypothetical protein